MTPDGRLTGEQRRLIDELCGQWEARAAKRDRRDAEQALGELYDLWGWERPKAVVWLESPLAGAIAARALLYGHRYLDGDRHPEVHKRWVSATTARLQGAFGTFDRHEVTDFEENNSVHPRWQLPDVLSAYKHAHDMEAPDLQAVLARVGEPAWAINGWVSARFKEEALSPSDPERFAAVGADVHARLDASLAEGLAPLFPAEQREVVQEALRSCADAPHPDDWKQWRQVWAAVRAPVNHALLILETVRQGGAGPLPARLRMASAAGWWWALNDIAVLTPPPAEVHTDSWERLHREDGPAVRYADGFAQYCWRGRLVPPDLIDPGWSAADIVHASDEELHGRAVAQFGPASSQAARRAERVSPDLRRCALERLGWARVATEAPLDRVGEAAADPGDPGCELTLYDVPARVFGRPARVVVREGGARDGSGLLVPADATDPVAAASWLGDAVREPAPPPELLTRIWDSEPMRDALAGLELEMSHVSHFEHVEEVHLFGEVTLSAFGGSGTGGTYFLCGDGPRRPVLYADSEGGYQVMGRDLTEALEFMVSAHPDGGDPEEADDDAARELGVRPLQPEEYRARQDQAEAMAAALVLLMTDEGNAYEYRRSTWFRC
ncbi:DUF6745 domain-containing protein [Actinomadura welshii]